MKRGILFSMDAILALLAVILFFAWTPQLLNVSTEEANGFESFGAKVFDEATIMFYKEFSSIDSVSDPEFDSAKFVRCVDFYVADSSNDLGNMENVSDYKNTYCEGR